MIIRNATLDDVEAAARVYLESLTAAYADVATEEYLRSKNLEDCIKQWTENIRDELCSVVVADENGDIKGLASLGAARDADVDVETTGEIQAIYVAPSIWGNGVGQELCRHSLEQLYSLSATSVLLWVLASNFRARQFYERAGFLLEPITKTVTMGHKLTAVRYRRPVDKAK